MITEAFHEGAERFDEQYAAFKKYETSGSDWAKLPVPEGRNRLDTETKQTITVDIDLFGSKRPQEASQALIPKPTLKYAPRLKYQQPTAEVTAKASLMPPGDDTFFKVNKPKLDAVINDVRRDMDIARYAAAQRMGSLHEEIVRKADMFLQTGTMTLNQAIDMTSKEAAKAGLNCIEYKNGRRVNITSYIELALRASSRRASLTAEGAKRDEWGHHLVVSPTLHSTCPSCGYWQGKILIDDVYSNGQMDYEHQLLSYAVKWAWEDGEKIRSHFLGVNCRHPLVTYFPGVTQIPTASPYDKTKRQYKAEEKQRYIERLIRANKRWQALAITEEQQLEAKRAVRQLQAKMRRHLFENPQLRRQPHREKIYLPDGETG